MRTRLALAPSVLACALSLGACASGPKPTGGAVQAGPTGIDESALDPSVSPCDNFYQYACGSWLKRTPIPADRAAWMRGFSEIDERNNDLLKKILEDLAAGKAVAGADPYGQKLGDFYASCMDEAKIEASADAEVAALLKEIDALKTPADLARQVARMHVRIGAPLFGFHSQQDFKDANLVIALADQGGLGLPDRDYYLEDAAKSKEDAAKAKELREKYRAHVARMLELAGAPVADAAKQAGTVMGIETALARASMSRVDRRDPKKIYHRLERDGLIKLSPKFDWTAYLAELGYPAVTQINVATPDFFTGVNSLLTQVPLADWRVYLKWNLLHAAAPALSKKFVDENFAFYQKTLQGVDQILPRWKRCVQMADSLLGEALARPFVKLTFGEGGKADTQAMVKNVEAAMEVNVRGLGWMDDATRKASFEKLHAIRNKIGYPDAWRNYDALAVTRDSYLKNLERGFMFEAKRDLDKIGKPVDRGEWQMTPPMVNAYYDPSLNEMVFPAGILQPPFYNREAAAAVNYGAIGMVMGHELTHGFDDEGRQFDAQGNLRDWWSAGVGQEFERRAACVVKQYDAYTVLGEHLNGKLTLGENIADLGGIKLAYAAYAQGRKAPQRYTQGGTTFTDDQLFFLGTAQAWCGNRREAMARLRVKTDPHSDPEHRVNGPLSNLPEFARAFQCKAGQPMVRTEQCVVW